MAIGIVATSVKEFDSDTDGKVSFGEFTRWLDRFGITD